MIYDKLFDWQKAIIDKYKDKENFGIWLDMGLGKTPISLAFAEKHRCSKIILISLKNKILETDKETGSFLNWLNQSNIIYNVIYKTSKNAVKQDSNDIFLINYESLFKRNTQKFQLNDKLEEFIKTCKDNNCCVIIDESHKMNDSQSKQSKAIKEIKRKLLLISKNSYFYLLSGTPFTNGYIDLYNQMKFLGYNKNKSEFKDKYCIIDCRPGLYGWQQPVIGYKNIDDLYEEIHNFAITIKSDFVIPLPKQIFMYIPTPLSSDFGIFSKEYIKKNNLCSFLSYKNLNPKIIQDFESYKDTQKIPNPFYRNIDYPNTNYLADTPGLFWLRSRELSIGFQGNAEEFTWYNKDRLNKLEEFLTQNEDNYILFYNYTPELFEIYDICKRLNYNIDIYSGDIKSLYFYEKYSKQTEEQKFNNKKNIIISNFASGSTGKNWQEYNKCIIFSLPLYKDYEQSIKRIHRIGQKSTVFYYIFYQKNWLDYSMKKALEEKKNYNQKMFDEVLKKNLEENYE